MPSIQLLPNPIDFSAVYLGNTSQIPFEIRNNGPIPVRVDQVEVDPQGYTEGFFLPGYGNSRTVSEVVQSQGILSIDVGFEGLNPASLKTGELLITGGQMFTISVEYKPIHPGQHDNATLYVIGLNQYKHQSLPLFDYIVKRLLDSFDLPDGVRKYIAGKSETRDHMEKENSKRLRRKS